MNEIQNHVGPFRPEEAEDFKVPGEGAVQSATEVLLFMTSSLAERESDVFGTPPTIVEELQARWKAANEAAKRVGELEEALGRARVDCSTLREIADKSQEAVFCTLETGDTVHLKEPFQRLFWASARIVPHFVEDGVTSTGKIVGRWSDGEKPTKEFEARMKDRSKRGDDAATLEFKAGFERYWEERR